MNVLIVDDNEIDQEVIERCLKKAQHIDVCIEGASTGADALVKISSKQFHVIFIDYMLPDLSGLSLMSSILEIEQPIKPELIMITGQGNEKVAVEAMKIGANDYIVKADVTTETISRIMLSASEKIKLKTELVENRIKADYLSVHDQLTGLFSRSYFENSVLHMLENVRDNNQEVIIILINLDNFQSINNIYSHRKGDEVIVLLSQFLKDNCNEDYVLSRYSGDEFAILLDESGEPKDAVMFCQKIFDFLENDMCVNDQKVKMSASIGIASSPYAGEDVFTLMKNVDIAMHRAKENGKARFSFYSEDLDFKAKQLINISFELESAIKNNELFLVYQPVIDLKTEKVVSFEVLLRWQNAKYGFIPPDEFIEIAENSDLIITIGNWVIQNSLQEFSAVIKENWRDIKLSINLSSNQLLDAHDARDILALVKSTDFKVENLAFELTERAIIKDLDHIIDQLNQLTAASIKIYIDDFGTGISSLTLLSRLPVSCLKIDKSFTQNIDSDKAMYNIVKSVITLSQSLSLTNISEGIETKEQNEQLIRFGAQYGQGYLFAKPMKIDQVATFLTEWDAQHD
ncbi:MAG: GGDEF domain-containing response regulator [Coxiellaceae bacterium]|nr:GGDEF domain-containing response regulator [Coxiellaceae bacterium]